MVQVKLSPLSKKRYNLNQELVQEKRYLFQGLFYLRQHHQVFFSLIIVFGVVLVWRGLWGLVDRYWLPNMPAVSSLTSLVVGIIVLYLSHQVVNKLAKY